jgi:hypothetical protein
LNKTPHSLTSRHTKLGYTTQTPVAQSSPTPAANVARAPGQVEHENARTTPAPPQDRVPPSNALINPSSPPTSTQPDHHMLESSHTWQAGRVHERATLAPPRDQTPIPHDTSTPLSTCAPPIFNYTGPQMYEEGSTLVEPAAPATINPARVPLNFRFTKTPALTTNTHPPTLRPPQPQPGHVEPPRVQGWNAELVVANVNTEQLQKWNDLPYPKLFVYLWEGKYQGNAALTAARLRATIANLVNIPEPAVVPPDAARPSSRYYAAPWCFLVTKIPSEAAEKLILQQHWSTPSITFFAIPFTPPVSRHLCSIENLIFQEVEADEVATLIRTTIHNNERARAFIHSSDPLPNALKRITDSIEVRALQMHEKGGEPKMIWNIYANSPTNSLTAHREWLQIAQSLRFVTALNGVGTPFQLQGCVGCKSTDHPTGLCPFPKLPGWFAPPNSSTSEVPTSLLSQQSATGGARGSRGGGNQRAYRGSRGRWGGRPSRGRQ